jgi:hypothetical protein
MQSYARVRILDAHWRSAAVNARVGNPAARVSSPTAVVVPSPGAITRLRPLGGQDVGITGGLWHERLRVNREQTLPHVFGQLVEVGNLHNLRLAAGAGGQYQALGIMFDGPFPFLDSDVYKWLEGVAWELGRTWDPAIAAMADEAIDAIAAAQREDGYLNTFVQVLAPGREYKDLQFGHELYCIGHLIQAGVAWHRALGDDRLLAISRRAADSVDAALGPNGATGIDGHPEIEMALVELYRATGEARYLELARLHVERRGHGLLGNGRFGAPYWQDHLPVREATDVAGHVVRQLYLDAGAVDVATETGDTDLLDAVHRRWLDMVATRSYLTGGVGSRHEHEGFGDPYELPPDRAYAETCAAIASTMLAWRLLLATGDPDCADVIERTIYNGVLSGVSIDGLRFFYVNPLQRRTHRVAADSGTGERAPWYACACCPPNLVRTFGSWPQYLATTDDDGIQIHQYAAAEIRATLPGGDVALAVETDYPWDGRVRITVRETPDTPWSLNLRVPGWVDAGSVDWYAAAQGAVDPHPPSPIAAGDRLVTCSRVWHAGDAVVLDLDMPGRITRPAPQVDAIRGCAALERGPLVYCIESTDLAGGLELEDLSLDVTTGPVPVARPDLGQGTVGLTASAMGPGGAPVTLAAVPYHAWGNRPGAAMRVWVPSADAGAGEAG